MYKIYLRSRDVQNDVSALGLETQLHVFIPSPWKRLVLINDTRSVSPRPVRLMESVKALLFHLNVTKVMMMRLFVRCETSNAAASSSSSSPSRIKTIFTHFKFHSDIVMTCNIQMLWNSLLLASWRSLYLFQTSIKLSQWTRKKRKTVPLLSITEVWDYSNVGVAGYKTIPAFSLLPSQPDLVLARVSRRRAQWPTVTSSACCHTRKHYVIWLHIFQPIVV